MTPPLPTPAEHLSALADGQCPHADLAQTLAASASDAQLQARWRDYQLIGDVLRGHAAGQADELAFVARLRPALRPAAVHAVHVAAPAANAPSFAWPWLAAAACLALAVGVFWTLPGVLTDAPELAWREGPVLAASSQGTVVRDAAIEELLEAHRQQGEASVLPMPSGFLRNATFEAAPATLVRPGSVR